MSLRSFCADAGDDDDDDNEDDDVSSDSSSSSNLCIHFGCSQCCLFWFIFSKISTYLSDAIWLLHLLVFADAAAAVASVVTPFRRTCFCAFSALHCGW